MKHDDVLCHQVIASEIETRHFTAYVEKSLVRRDQDPFTIVTLGTVARGYPKKRGEAFAFFSECSPGFPWVATPRVPRRLKSELKPLGGGPDRKRLGPFRTRADALRALDEWWVRLIVKLARKR